VDGCTLASVAVTSSSSSLGLQFLYPLYPVLIERTKTAIDRDPFLNTMTAENIGIEAHYLSIPEHPYYQQKFGWQPEDYP